MDDPTTTIEFGGQSVDVPKGGYYDRFRMNPDLDAVARDPAAGDITLFRRIPKQKVASRVGPVWAPNFFYRSSSVQVLMRAPLARLRAMIPAPLEPLRVVPGHGLVALSFFAYTVCDNDPYNEVAVSVLIRKPGARGPQALELVQDLRRRSVFAHTLALPVNTEIARVRGLHGYQLPKWLARIDISIGETVRCAVAATDGTPDVTMVGPCPPLRAVPSQSRMGTNTMIGQIDGRWHKTAVQSNTLTFGQRLFPRSIALTRHGGPISQLLDGLGARAILRLDVVKDAQFVLNMPVPITAFDRVGT